MPVETELFSCAAESTVVATKCRGCGTFSSSKAAVVLIRTNMRISFCTSDTAPRAPSSSVSNTQKEDGGSILVLFQVCKVAMIQLARENSLAYVHKRTPTQT